MKRRLSPAATSSACVEAARKEAFDTAFCLSTDATGVSVQPRPIQERKDKKPGPCRKGHFFVVLADKDHVFCEYQPKHTSAAVCEMFRGFSGYIQADAHALYDALFRGTSPRGARADEGRGPPPTEVGCWSYCRTNSSLRAQGGIDPFRVTSRIRFAKDTTVADSSSGRARCRPRHGNPRTSAGRWGRPPGNTSARRFLPGSLSVVVGPGWPLMTGDAARG
ncbi:IS66 family transposase [Sorangium sp. So ce363]|uniref:IS66 family transposase n=1 Tax=Sorangium sp. So ce363 TaxID=3133304 RepID=UPI003F5FE745